MIKLKINPNLEIINKISNKEDYFVYKIKPGDRLDVVAFNVYGDSSKWNLIADFNNINFFEIDSLEELKIPNIN